MTLTTINPQNFFGAAPRTLTLTQAPTTGKARRRVAAATAAFALLVGGYVAHNAMSASASAPCVAAATTSPLPMAAADGSLVADGTSCRVETTSGGSTASNDSPLSDFSDANADTVATAADGAFAH